MSSKRNKNVENWVIHDLQLDLHGLNVEDAKKMVDKMLNRCSTNGDRQVTIIYGVGLGILKSKVGEYLKKHELVEEIRDLVDGTAAWQVTVADCRHNDYFANPSS